MATKPETQFRKRVRADLTKLMKSGKPLFFEAVQQRAINGSPDFFLCLNGRFLALELKDESGVVSMLQRVKMHSVVKAGGMGIVVDQGGWADVYSMIIDFLDNSTDHPNNPMAS